MTGAQRREPAVFDRGEPVDLIADGLRRRVRWGHPWQFDTASYWVAQATMFRPAANYRIGSTLAEEVAACILGGFGLPALVGVRAFEAVRDAGLLNTRHPSADQIEAILRQPLSISGRRVQYRFPRQRAYRVAAALRLLSGSEPPTEGAALRDWLLRLPGVGPKTASWIARNHTGTDLVAIIDIHVLRAGRRAGVFAPDWDPTRQYRRCEGFFLAWAAVGGVRASVLDACIWSQLSMNGSVVPQEGAQAVQEW